MKKLESPFPDDLIGRPIARVDGKAKVTGQALYATDRWSEAMVYATLASATIAKGRIASIDTTAARSLSDVLLVATHEERRPVIHRVALEMELTFGKRPHEDFPPLQGPEIHYSGQVVALVVARTPEAARHAAELIDIVYVAESAVTVVEAGPELDFAAAVPDALHIPKVKGVETDEVRGDLAAELAASESRLDETYATPLQYHAAIELHGRVARWEGDRLIVHEPSQWVAGTARAFAQALGIDDDAVEVVNPFVGGAFGGKAYFRYDAALCAWAARELGCPVKLELSREQVFVLGGARPATRQRIQLGATRSGRLRAVVHDTWSAVSRVDTNYQETCGYQTRQLYATASIRTTHRVVPFDIPSTCPMRAPGVGPGSFAIECAMDELAHSLEMDPLELRLLNYSEAEPCTNRPFSAKHLRACYAKAAEAIGWYSRRAEPRSRQEGEWLIGLGMASASYDVVQLKVRVRVALLDNGTAEISTAANDIGTGTYTILTQIAAETLGLPMNRIACRLGNSGLPAAGAAAGQSQANSVAPALVQAARGVVGKLVALAIDDAASRAEVVAKNRMHFEDGLIRADASTRGEPFEALLRRHGIERLVMEVESRPQKLDGVHSLQSWGAQFCEVAVHEATGEIRVRRVASAFDFGRVLNRATARSQLMGGIVFGIGMALLERGDYDPHAGRQVNGSLAEYLVPVNADVPMIHVEMIDQADFVAEPVLGVKGCGEIGNVGIAAAIANAVFNATGFRVRDLPITIEKLL